MFNLESSTGNKISLEGMAEKFAVIVFYPKNNTPGWNRQLATLESVKAQFESMNTEVLAINPASVLSHQNYCDKKGFSFPILSDPDEKIIAAYKSQKPEGNGVVRTVYAIDPNGQIIFAERGMADYKEIMEVIKTSS